ncbi:MAG: 2,3-bisphosphoglycerate-independent phosphoglycerate mutase [Patescibacteria group bacterium]|nr:2,3-bisphosphoglycerate-independent phosphoglycerate mutase [Patescibacteria group bacterium]
MAQQRTPTLLIILDGFGVAPPSRGNAITLSKTPALDRLFDLYSSGVLGATGTDVGLPDNKMSGSESGHMNIGAGRIVKQDSFYITESIKDGSFFMNPALVGAVKHVKAHQSKLHVMGLMGNADSPHSDPENFRAVLRLAKKNAVEEVYCHLFTDGRDSYPRSALEHLKNFKKIMSEDGIGKIATISGRFYAMDRAKNWKRLTKAYDAMVFSRGESAPNAEEVIQGAYEKNLTDEYILPTFIVENGKPVVKIARNDAVVFYNLRSDRARQFTKLFVALNKERIIKDDMPPLDKLENLYFTAMTDFGPDLDIHTAYKGRTLEATLPMVLGNRKQFYVAESEKFAHVTYFLNGGYADPVDGEDRMEIKSQAVENYAQIPEMSAGLITKEIIERLSGGGYDFITANFANADMVGHTGDLKATVKAVECLDEQIKNLAKIVLKMGGNLIITADHGNADVMIDPSSSQPNTFHTKNPVPFLLASDKFKNKKIESGGVLGNIAPTILEIMGIEKPKAMNKKSLIK